jgi:hypothetical protein
LCSSGMYSAAGQISCTVCDAGKYQDLRGQGACKPC